ncbi:hypothetical protein [Saccharothrix sp. NRRL B-16314]|uniref:hypothetical protein n=1 Tax=Saccharothrix sp. NRRL B-16314 TaxID=1463825 RepID=UPI000525DE33|nr:hypothetical protein [Saccharothrix sp. NRRL B-16314]
MPAVGFVLPILPGRTDDDREAMTSCWRGHRQEAFEASRQRLGITREAVWIQPTPTGDVAVVYVEADDLPTVFEGLATSQEPFDRWFRAYVREVHGVSLEDGSSPPEQVLDFGR